MFTTFIVRPLFNLLVGIYAVIPGHNFGLAIILFTLVIRLILWPLVKKQLRQAKIMRDLQPEIKRVKKEAGGNKQKESALLMELYKEKGVNPVGSIVVLIPQFIVLIGLYDALRQVASDPHSIITLSYPFIHNLSWMQAIAHNINLFDNTLFGIVNLNQSAAGGKGGIYWPAMIIVLASAIAQYYQSKQLMPAQKDSKSLRTILKEAGSGDKADQSEINASVARSTRFLLPVMIFLVTVNLPAALSLYWLTGGLIAYIQQAIVLRSDEQEMEAIADTPTKDLAKIPEGEVVKEPEPKTDTPNATQTKNTHKHSSKKRRKRK